MDCYNLWHTCINVSYIITALDLSLNLSLAGIFSGLTPRDEDDKGPVPSCGASVATVQLDSAQLGFGGFGWHALSESSQAINSPAGLCRLRLTCNLVMLVVHI